MNKPVAAIIIGDPRHKMTGRLVGLLKFFGVPWQIFACVSEFKQASLGLDHTRYAILGSLTSLAPLIEEPSKLSEETPIPAESIFCYLDQDTSRCIQLLRKLLRSPDATLTPLGDTSIKINVSKSHPTLTGPLRGLTVSIQPRPTDYALTADCSTLSSTIVGTNDRSCFFAMEHGGTPIFVSCTSDIPDLKGPLKGRYYDVKDEFLSTVPIVTYIKWAFRDSCWRNSEPGACLIIDDPLLRTKYGFCDFERIDKQMQEAGFTTNISFIPWNWRRTSNAAAALVRESKGRLSISVHGCDHTANEFGTNATGALHQKVALARQRMERHQKRSNVAYDPIMVFPQGVFSRESLSVLQQHEFLAAVNTEVSPLNGNGAQITIGDVWGVAISKYGNFPLFTRRYPKHGIANFAFDLLLGKPCLIVEHHEFFKDGGQEALEFIRQLNSLNCRLRWSSLGDVVRRTYQWRATSDDEMEVKMFAKELLLQNEERHEKTYRVQTLSEDGKSPKSVSVDGHDVAWETKGAGIAFSCRIPPKTKRLIRVNPACAPEAKIENESMTRIVRTAARRYFSEFRDNFVSQHTGLALLVQKAKVTLTDRSGNVRH